MLSSKLVSPNAKPETLKWSNYDKPRSGCHPFIRCLDGLQPGQFLNQIARY
jgi:hypothetical protein